jgi:hypothetical protein
MTDNPKCLICGEENPNADEHSRCPDCMTICVNCKDAVVSRMEWATVNYLDCGRVRFPVRVCMECEIDHATISAICDPSVYEKYLKPARLLNVR